MRVSILVVTTILFFSCEEKKQTLQEKQKEITTGKLDTANTYSVKEIGWTIQLPEGWQVLTTEELKAMNEKGKKLIEKSTGTDIDYSGLQELISIKKDRANSFTSNMQKFDTTTDGNYDDRVIALNQLLRNTYKANKMKFKDQVGATRIDGIMFDVFDIKLFAPKDDQKIILNQSMYSALINGYDFSMTINYNNDADKQTLMEIVASSKFSKRQ